jgi:hypothetical protein
VLTRKTASIGLAAVGDCLQPVLFADLELRMKVAKWSFFTLLLAAVRGLQPGLLCQSSPSPVPLNEPYRQAQFHALLQDGFQRWDNGYLITHGWNGTLQTSPSKPGVALYDKDGQIAREAVVWLDGARSVSVGDAATSRSGRLVVSGGSINQQGAIANLIAEIGADNRVRHVIRTTPFMPVYVCALDDGTVWSYGVDRDDHLAGIENSLRLRHYSFEKGQLRALLDATRLSRGEGWLLERGHYPGEINLRCNSQTLALYNAASSELVEVDLHSNSLKVTQVAPLPSPPEFQITGFALTDSGALFASFYDRSRKPAVSGLFTLNREAAGGAKWVPVEGTVGPYLHGSSIERLLGADGDDLVYTSLKDGKMFWSKQSSQ